MVFGVYIGSNPQPAVVSVPQQVVYTNQPQQVVYTNQAAPTVIVEPVQVVQVPRVVPVYIPPIFPHRPYIIHGGIHAPRGANYGPGHHGPVGHRR